MTVSPLTLCFLDFSTLPWYCGVATRSVRFVGKLMYRKESNMNTEELYKQYTQLLRGAPDVLTPSKIVKWTPFGKNRVYQLINSGELRSFQYRGSHIVTKADLMTTPPILNILYRVCRVM